MTAWTGVLPGPLFSGRQPTRFMPIEKVTGTRAVSRAAGGFFFGRATLKLATFFVFFLWTGMSVMVSSLGGFFGGVFFFEIGIYCRSSDWTSTAT